MACRLLPKVSNPLFLLQCHVSDFVSKSAFLCIHGSGQGPVGGPAFPTVISCAPWTFLATAGGES